MTEDDEQLFDELETNITALMPEEPMNRSKAFSFILKYARNFMELDKDVTHSAPEKQKPEKLLSKDKKLSAWTKKARNRI